MILSQETSLVVSAVQSSKNPAGLFEIPYLTFRNPKYPNIKIGTRKVFVDFPRIATELLLGFIGPYCNEKFENVVKGNPKTVEEFGKWVEGIQKVIREIREEKENSETEIGYISKNLLERIGIKWWIRFERHYERPVMIISANGYYKKSWSEKIKDFTQKLNEGYDYPSQIYDMASTLSPRYQKPQSQLRIPKIFEVFEDNGLSITNELKKLTKIIEKLRKIIVAPTYDVYYIYPIINIDSAFSDMLKIVDNLHNINNSGYFLSGYLLLRKLLIDLGSVLFSKSLAEYIQKIPEKPQNSKEEEMDIDFKTKWLKVCYDTSGTPFLVPIILERIEDNIDELLEIRNFEELKNQCNRGNFQSAIMNGKVRIGKKKTRNVRAVEVRDTLDIETIDILRLHKMLVFDAVSANIQVPSRKDKLRKPQEYTAYVEYHKLSDAVHNPILADFPPYSSTLEYLGFLHHMRIVNKIFQETLQAYKDSLSEERIRLG